MPKRNYFIPKGLKKRHAAKTFDNFDQYDNALQKEVKAQFKKLMRLALDAKNPIVKNDEENAMTKEEIKNKRILAFKNAAKEYVEAFRDNFEADALSEKTLKHMKKTLKKVDPDRFGGIANDNEVKRHFFYTMLDDPGLFNDFSNILLDDMEQVAEYQKKSKKIHDNIEEIFGSIIHQQALIAKNDPFKGAIIAMINLFFNLLDETILKHCKDPKSFILEEEVQESSPFIPMPR